MDMTTYWNYKRNNQFDDTLLINPFCTLYPRKTPLLFFFFFLLQSDVQKHLGELRELAEEARWEAEREAEEARWEAEREVEEAQWETERRAEEERQQAEWW